MTTQHPEELPQEAVTESQQGAQQALDVTMPGAGQNDQFIEAIAFYTGTFIEDCEKHEGGHYGAMIGVAGALRSMDGSATGGAVAWFSIMEDEVDALIEGLQLTKAAMGLDSSDDG